MDTQKIDSLHISNVDLFHVDGDPSYKGVIHDLDLASKSINETGLILVDDIDYIGTVKTGVTDWLNKNHQFDGEYVKSLRGEMLTRKK